MKACFKCGTEKPLSEFYRHSKMADGHLNKCKDCTKSDVTQHRNEHIDSIRAYDRKRSMEPHRVEVRKEYAKTESGKQAHARALFRSRNKFPEKYAARVIFGNALRDGKVKRPNNCSCCGKSCTPHGHHDDYSKPLEVMWLCVPCHAARHQLINAMKAA